MAGGDIKVLVKYCVSLGGREFALLNERALALGLSGEAPRDRVRELLRNYGERTIAEATDRLDTGRWRNIIE